MTGLWRWKPGPPKLYPLPDPTLRINALIEDDGGELLIAKRSGITRLKNGKVEAYPIPAGLQFKPYTFLRDRHGGLWIGASVDSGLMHVHDGRTDLFTRSDGMSSDSVTSFFEDREGNIWVGTADGLDRFREPAIATISVEQGLSSRGLSSVLAARDGSVWLGTSDGLNRWKNGQLTTYGKRSGGDAAEKEEGFPERPRTSGTDKRRSRSSSTVREITGTGLPEDEVYSLFEDDQGRLLVATAHGVGFFESERFIPVSSLPGGFVYSITGDNAGNVWISHAQGLFRLLRATVVERIPWAQLGRKEVATAVLRDTVRGGLWLGFRESGVAFFKDGQLRASYAEGEGIVNELRLGPRGALWAATQSGLTRIKDGHVTTLTQKNGLPCDAVQWTVEDDDHDVWLNMPCGLVRIAKSELDAWAADPKRTVPVTVFDSSDGVRSHSYTGGFNPRVAKSADGRLWFLPADGVSILDPRHLSLNKLPPPVYIEQVIADEKPYNARNGMHLPPRIHYLSIDYTALSLVAPEKMRFRYKLEGVDPDWREVLNDREVQYSNLGPGTYRFRLKASNNSGVWNEEGAALEFVITPAWYQTNWFYGLCAAAFVAWLWAAYQLRVRQLAYQFNMRFEERVAERTRIARDLHDTLLQSFQALLLRFQAVIRMLPDRPVDARRTLEDAVDRASQAITEGRDAVQGLRLSTVEKNDLAVAIRTFGEGLASAESSESSPEFKVVVEGISRNLHPILRDEVYRLAAEALRNAFRHAAAENVEVEIRYDEKYFRLRIRDDGKGIASDVLSGRGHEGHYGLPGMRERAKLVGGKLTVWTELDSGTEIELIIPGARAYVKSTRPFWYFGKRSATETDKEETIERE
jgi:signal transduction histidine kinase